MCIMESLAMHLKLRWHCKSIVFQLIKKKKTTVNDHRMSKQWGIL